MSSSSSSSAASSASSSQEVQNETRKEVRKEDAKKEAPKREEKDTKSEKQDKEVKKPERKEEKKEVKVKEAPKEDKESEKANDSVEKGKGKEKSKSDKGEKASEKGEKGDKEKVKPKKDGAELVCVTGATGFIAAHIVRHLLEKGYRVRGTVRGSKTDKVNFLRAFPGATERLELIDCDLLGPEGTFDDAVKGCDYVLHTASPFKVSVKDPVKDLLEPAVNGTLSVLKSCLKYQKTIKKVVVTSSIAAVTDCAEIGKVYDESVWNNESSSKRNHYFWSKAEAEKAAHAFVKKEAPSWKLACVLPSFVLGPSLNAAVSESVSVTVFDLIRGKVPAILAVSFSMVDVRDVAIAHAEVMANPKAEGRYLTCSSTMSLKDITKHIKETFPGYSGALLGGMPWMDFTGKAGQNLSFFVGNFYDKGKHDYLIYNVGRDIQFSNKRITTELGMTFRDVKVTIDDTVRDLVKWKHLPDKLPKEGDEKKGKSKEKAKEKTGDKKEEKHKDKGDKEETTKKSKPASEHKVDE